MVHPSHLRDFHKHSELQLQRGVTMSYALAAFTDRTLRPCPLQQVTSGGCTNGRHVVRTTLHRPRSRRRVLLQREHCRLQHQFGDVRRLAKLRLRSLQALEAHQQTSEELCDRLSKGHCHLKGSIHGMTCACVCLLPKALSKERICRCCATGSICGCILVKVETTSGHKGRSRRLGTNATATALLHPGALYPFPHRRLCMFDAY